MELKELIHSLLLVYTPMSEVCEAYNQYEKDNNIPLSNSVTIWRRVRMVSEEIQGELTEGVHQWMKSLDDDGKLRFAINWRMADTLFSVACGGGMFPGGQDSLQFINWYKIYKSHDLGVWSHGGKVMV